MRGEPWRYFNLVSAPHLSLNAQFLPVPDRFVHGQITDTVLGTLHLATCNATTRHTLGVLFDVFDGTLKCTLRTTPGGAKESVPCANELAAAGVTVRREVSGCKLSTMECALAPEEEAAAVEAEDASFVRVHLERFNISLAGGARLSFLRDLVVNPNATKISQACPLPLPVCMLATKQRSFSPSAASRHPPLCVLLTSPDASYVPASLTARGSRLGLALCGLAR